MATQTYEEASLYDQGSGGSFTVSIKYDDVSLLILAVVYGNSSPNRDAKWAFGNHSGTIPANTALTTLDVSKVGDHVTVTPTHHGNAISVPGGDFTCGWAD